MQSLLKLLAHIAKSFGISSPSDNARVSASWKEKQRTSISTSPDPTKPPLKNQC
jgi:hypothetical protein